MTSQTPREDFSVNFLNRVPIVQLPSKVSVLEAVAFKNTCHQLLQEIDASQIVLDFAQTKFIDSSGVGALVHNLKATKAKNIQLILTNVPGSVMAVLSMTGLDEVLEIESLIGEPQQDERRNLLSPPQTHPSLRSFPKRALDIVGAIVGLTITSIALLPIALAIFIESPGPIFYSQIRCGWMGKKFRIWKFRSMCLNADVLKAKIPNQASGAFFKNDNDPRITKIGRFLRRTSLDELPQFWNVLMGDMSLVGTRPPTPDEVEKYQVPQWQRLDVKPGMTGEWQVNGRSKVRDFEDVIKLDLRYQENWSLQYDIQLIFKTILILFDRNSGAM